MKRLAIVFVLMLSSLSSVVVQAQVGTCSTSTQGGGVDIFPWSLAQPFPWSSIQGLWKVSDEPDNVMKFRVVRENDQVKHLSVQVMSRTECSLIMKGVGIITASEKNVVRINLVDQAGQPKLMKLAFFHPVDLKMTGDGCEQTVLAASVIEIGSESQYKKPTALTKSNVMLKKITNSLDFYCRKKKN